jgi:hypothetical protein
VVQSDKIIATSSPKCEPGVVELLLSVDCDGAAGGGLGEGALDVLEDTALGHLWGCAAAPRSQGGAAMVLSRCCRGYASVRTYAYRR